MKSIEEVIGFIETLTNLRGKNEYYRFDKRAV